MQQKGFVYELSSLHALVVQVWQVLLQMYTATMYNLTNGQG